MSVEREILTLFYKSSASIMLTAKSGDRDDHRGDKHTILMHKQAFKGIYSMVNLDIFLLTGSTGPTPDNLCNCHVLHPNVSNKPWSIDRSHPKRPSAFFT